MNTTKNHRNHLHRVLACVSLGVSLVSLSLQAYPTIGIQGLTGAEHWVWIEGEYNKNRSEYNAFQPQQSPSSLLSGYMADGPANVWEKTTGTVSPIIWDLYAPAAMSSNTGLYAKALLSPVASRALTINIDGFKVSEDGLTMHKRGHGGIPADWLGMNSTSTLRADLSGITAGAHEIEFVSDTWGWKWDGFLIYDGMPTRRDVADNGTGRFWMQNPGSVSSPVLEGIVAPTFSIGGTEEGYVVQYLLNGLAYTPGTPIGPGENYELVVAIYESSAVNSQRLAFAGANFSVIPEPGTYALIFAGLSLALVIARRRKA